MSGQDAANESPRERSRVLTKRNPIASEYQQIGALGLFPGAASDAESVDFRGLFGSAGTLSAATEPSNELYLELNYNELSGNAEAGGGVEVSAPLGKGSGTAVAFSFSTTASDRVFEHGAATWGPFEPTQPAVDATLPDDLNYLTRLRLSQDLAEVRQNRFGFDFEHAFNNEGLFRYSMFLVRRDNTDYRNRQEWRPSAQSEADDPELFDFVGTTLTRGAFVAEPGNRSIRRYFHLNSEERTIQRHMIAVSLSAADWLVDASLYGSDWKIDEEGSFAWNFYQTGIDFSYTVEDGWFPEPEVTGEVDVFDQSEALFNDLRINRGKTRDRDYAGRIDLQSPREGWGPFERLDAGLLFRTKERTATDRRDVYFDNPDAPFALGDLEWFAPGEIVRDRYIIPRGLNPHEAERFFEGNPERFVFQPGLTESERGQNTFRAQETVWGFYGNVRRSFRGFEVEAGLRWEMTSTETFDALSGESASQDYDDFFPSLQVQYEVTDSLELRAYTAGYILRPNYIDIVPFRRIFLGVESISEGNPALDAVSIRNYAAAFVWDTGSFGDLSGEIYYTSISDFFYDGTAETTLPGNSAIFQVNRPENGEEGSIRGFQLQWTGEIGFSGEDAFDLNYTLSYTYSDTEATIDSARRPAEQIALPERAEHLLEVRLGGAVGRYGWNVGLTHRSDTLDEVGEIAASDEYRESQTILDAGLRARINEGMTVSLSLFNLLDTPERSYEGNPLRFTNNLYSSWSGRVRTTFSF